MPEEWLTLQRAEEVFCVPVATWRRWLRERRVGCSRLGGRILIRRAEVDAWLAANFRPASEGRNGMGKKCVRVTTVQSSLDPNSILAKL